MTLVARLDASAADVRLIADSIPHIVWLTEANGSTEYFNQQGWTYTGLPPETTYGWNWLAHVHPDDADRATRAWHEATRTQSSCRIDFRMRRFDGRVPVALVSGSSDPRCRRHRAPVDRYGDRRR